MGKKQHAEEHENLERWMVSYADFVTLLFAVFVVLYALSQIDLAKFENFSESLKEAFSVPKPASVLQGGDGILDEIGADVFDAGGFSESDALIPPFLQQIAEKEEKKRFGMMEKDLDVLDIDEHKGIKTEVTERGLIINMVGNVFFKPGESQLKEEGLKTINQIGELLKEHFPLNVIRVEGHTDNTPINTARFPSNWELSAQRAAGVVRYFTDVTGFDKNRFVAVGYGDSRPLELNDTQEGRNANRRIEIVVLKSKLYSAELKTYKFQKQRLERLKEIEKQHEQQIKEEAGMSDAARKLLKEEGSAKPIVISPDSYDKESKELLEKVKDIEKNKKERNFFQTLKKGFKNSEK